MEDSTLLLRLYRVDIKLYVQWVELNCIPSKDYDILPLNTVKVYITARVLYSKTPPKQIRREEEGSKN